MKIFAPIFFAVIVCFFGCKEEQKVTNSAEETVENVQKFTITPFSESASYPDALLSNMIYQDGKFSFDVASDSYELGVQTPDASSKMCANSAKGQHIHLIVDNLPYAAKYESSFEHEVSDGDHTILAFLSRSYHESIKTATAHILQNVTVENGTIKSQSNVEAPMLTYSRPKGTYVGDDTKKVMLDFYLSNVELKDGYTVEANINGEVHEISTWQPYYIEGMPMGENSITLTLMKDGQKVDTPLNPVTRKFTLKEDPLPEG